MPPPTAAPCPAVSVIVPAYNVAPYIGEALESLFQQSFTDYEAIVVNDGSTDETERVVDSFQDRIIYLRQSNRGPAAARNTALRRARGRYVALLDGDDTWMPNYLETLVAPLEADPEIDLIFPNAVYFGSSPGAGRLYQDVYPANEPITLEKLLTRESNVFVSAVFKREVVASVGGFDETLPAAEDFDLWVRIAQHGARFASTAEPLVRYRQRGASLTSDYGRMLHAEIRVYEKVLATSPVGNALRELVAPRIAEDEAELNLIQARQSILARDFPRAALHIARANTYLRRRKLTLAALALRLAPELTARLVARRQAATLREQDAGRR